VLPPQIIEQRVLPYGDRVKLPLQWRCVESSTLVPVQGQTGDERNQKEDCKDRQHVECVQNECLSLA